MDKITITREQFNEVVMKASDEYVDLAPMEVDDIKGAVTTFVLGLQNIAFASLIEKHLFGEEPIKEDTTINEKEGK